MVGGGINMYHHSLILAAHLAPAQAATAAAIAAAVTAGGLIARRVRRARGHT